jgi:pilus assembly protein CpaF
MRLEQLALAAAPELGLSAVRSMVAMGLDVVALMGRVNRSGRVQRTLQAIATIKGINAKGDYCLNYLYRAEGDESLPVFEQAYHQLEGMK